MNKIIISSDNLKPALDKLGHAINSKSVLPVLLNLKCKAAVNKLELIASNLELTIIMNVECETSPEPFEFLLPFDLISKIVAMNKHCPIAIESGKKIKITGSNDDYEYKVAEKLEDFPKVPELPKKNSVDIEPEVLASIKIAATTAAKPEQNPKLAHVLLELSAGAITIASTDGSVMVFTKEFKVENDHIAELLINPNVIKVIDMQSVAKVCFTQKIIGIESSDTIMICTRSEEKYVNFRKVFPAEWPANLKINKLQLMEAFMRCTLSSDEMKKAVLKLSKDSIRMLTDDYKLKTNVLVPAAFTGDVSEMSVNYEKFLKVLHQISADDIELGIHDANKLIVITANDDLGYKGMIMPMATTK